MHAPIWTVAIVCARFICFRIFPFQSPYERTLIIKDIYFWAYVQVVKVHVQCRKRVKVFYEWKRKLWFVTSPVYLSVSFVIQFWIWIFRPIVYMANLSKRLKKISHLVSKIRFVVLYVYPWNSRESVLFGSHIFIYIFSFFFPFWDCISKYIVHVW